MKISLITTCKGRLDHLKQVIPSWIDFAPFEIIVVDVSCPQGTGAWLKDNYPAVNVVFQDFDGFNLATARNIGASMAKGDYLFFVDADIVLQPGFHDWIASKLPDNSFLLRHQDNPYEGIHEQGTVLCRKDDFARIAGYDEVIRGYGGEDLDLYERLSRAGARRFNAPKEFILALEHDDEMRTTYYKNKDKKIHSVICRTYRAAKSTLLSINPEIFELPLPQRAQIWQTCEAVLGHELSEMPNRGEIVVKATQGRWLPEPYYLACELVLKLSVKVRP